MRADSPGGRRRAWQKMGLYKFLFNLVLGISTRWTEFQSCVLRAKCTFVYFHVFHEMTIALLSFLNIKERKLILTNTNQGQNTKTA